MDYDKFKINRALVAALQCLELDDESIDDAQFHMTDWMGDLKAWNAFCEDPDSLEPEELAGLITKFLVHVPAHLAAASKIITGLPVTDVFGIGATSEGRT